ncbi:hypothetical protein QMK19_15735 [Streptomyces sp. H10-C2]|uniref:hypothetical protein n=1 Tax=unclassified Streptomyces TaxID=2593676 RepID=UPI0024BBDBF8|nr:MULTISPECIES: hypothetical protein [unclassified Streptomyces]MDJ0343156.1 hypothetical protein [Streptomyces sp. PH10-H1]MDJ0371098.1 hypothetical protein [Streptomyces sp. H10-C2]
MPIRGEKQADSTPTFGPWGPYVHYVHRIGWLLLAAGAVLCVLGWYGVAGERYAERQIPYLASSSIPGAALIVAGAVLASRPGPRPSDPASDPDSDRQGPGRAAQDARNARNARKEKDERDGAGIEPVAVSAGPPVAVPGGTLLHRPDCPLVQGKPDAAPAGPADVRARALTPCPVCAPGR